MATGGFKSNATTDFLEEWKAKREKMRAKMLGDIAAASNSSLPAEEPQHPAANLKKASPQTDGSAAACPDSPDMPDRTSPCKEKKSCGPSARKGKGQIEKRKLREKRRSTGVVSMPSNEDTPRPGSGRPKSEEELGANSRHHHNRHIRDVAPGSLEKRLEELEKELSRERQETARLLKAHQDKDHLIDKLKEEIHLLNRDLDDIEDENEQLKQENKTLLKVVGQLTRSLGAGGSPDDR
ncbi:PRKC apoptosis WT1 regulator protein isoform X3 [Dunckerocampus dactyliophorus]|uniref:PRKC apoptosis WT1 regulator protein isoform X3 n=1 Tax=Dunckerocampus dactyliophorus TaxID=161453 RepID=UPI002404E384|nr:PRKC apoptosis WT1 regulator protein isoform X3 [Dunckerocampus dactyliophorus]